MRVLFVISSALALVSCASPVSNVDQDAAARDYVSCLKANARTLDDHHSDASTIAYAIQSACNYQFEHDLDLQSRGMSIATAMQFKRQARQGAIGLATDAVLRERQGR
jgi:hypothetical protein